MKRPINVQPEVKAYYLEIQMQGGGEQKNPQQPSFYRIRPAISQHNNRPLSDINVLQSARKTAQDGNIESYKMLKVTDGMSHALRLMGDDRIGGKQS